MKRKRLLLTSLVVILLLVTGSSLVSASPRAQQDEQSCTIWGRVCVDADQDGNCDIDEQPLAYVMVTLLDEDGDEVETQRTSSAGLYQFTVTDAESGDDYTVVETDPDGYTSVNANVIEVEVEPGERVHAGDFCDVPATVEPPTPMICTLSARAFIDFRQDGVFQAGVDIPLENVPVTVSLPDGTSAVLETTSFGMVYFPGFDAAGGVSPSVELPQTYRSYTLSSSPGSPTTIQLQPDNFHFDHAFVQFGAQVVGEAAGP
jgi:hypothetical protein